MSALRHQPIAVVMCANYPEILFYKSGVIIGSPGWNDPDCVIDHSVLLVGYGYDAKARLPVGPSHTVPLPSGALKHGASVLEAEEPMGTLVRRARLLPNRSRCVEPRRAVPHPVRPVLRVVRAGGTTSRARVSIKAVNGRTQDHATLSRLDEGGHVRVTLWPREWVRQALGGVQIRHPLDSERVGTVFRPSGRTRSQSVVCVWAPIDAGGWRIVGRLAGRSRRPGVVVLRCRRGGARRAKLLGVAIRAAGPEGVVAGDAAGDGMGHVP